MALVPVRGARAGPLGSVDEAVQGVGNEAVPVRSPMLVDQSRPHAAVAHPPHQLTGARYYLLELTFLEDGTATLRTQGARRLAEAQDLYEAAERVSERHRDRDVLLVTVESFEQLKRAYPNYYADTHTFRHLLGEAMGHAKTARQESRESERPPVGRNNRPPE